MIPVVDDFTTPGPVEVWPDGEGPLDPTAFDVAEEMGNGGSVKRVLEDWNMNEPSVRVDGVTVEFT